MASKLAKADLTAERVLEELRRAAFFDIRQLFTKKGLLKRISELPEEVASALASAEVIRTNLVSGDNQREWLHKVRAVDKMAALAILAKHFRLLEDRIEVHGSLELELKFKTLDEGRMRNAARTDALALPPGTGSKGGVGCLWLSEILYACRVWDWLLRADMVSAHVPRSDGVPRRHSRQCPCAGGA